MNTFVPKQIDGWEEIPTFKNVTSFSNMTSVKFSGSHNNNPFPFIIHKSMKLSFLAYN